jgi:chemotaxis protein CheD
MSPPPALPSSASAAPPTSSRDIERSAHNVHPGDWAIETQRPLATLLGSCVSVCLFDERARLGGMNHFMLPSGSKTPNSEQDALLHGDYAMEVLVNAMLARGARKDRLIAKAFGGGNIVKAIRTPIGERNIQFAREWLTREGISLQAADFGGPWSRKILFEPENGVAWCKRILGSQQASAEVVREEDDYARRLVEPKPTTGKRVELF